jgi:hypothetical protein
MFDEILLDQMMRETADVAPLFVYRPFHYGPITRHGRARAALIEQALLDTRPRSAGGWIGRALGAVHARRVASPQAMGPCCVPA